MPRRKKSGGFRKTYLTAKARKFAVRRIIAGVKAMATEVARGIDLFSLSLSAVVFVAAAVSAVLIYGETVHQLDYFVKHRLRALATLAAAQTDASLHAQLTRPSDEQSDAYRTLREPHLEMLKANDDLIYVYTITRCGDRFCIIMDTELPRSGERVVHSPVMTVYEAPTATLKRVLSTGVGEVEAAPYTDEYGAFLSAYAPLKGTASGKGAVVGVDMSLRQYKLKIAMVRERLIIGLIAAALLSLGLGLAVSRFRRGAEIVRKKHRSIITNMPAAIVECRLTDSLDVTFVNDYITTLAGYLPSDFTHGELGLVDLVPAEERTALVSGIRAQLATGDRFDSEFRLLPAPVPEVVSQRPIWVRLSGVRTGRGADGIGIFEGFMSNITLRKATEAKMLESERQFRSLADGTPNLLWITNIYGESLFFNKTWLDFTGRSLDDEIDDGWLAHIHPDDKDICLEKFIGTLSEVRSFQCWFRLKRHDGEYRWMLAVCTPRYTASGKCDGYISAATDITDRKAFEARLKETSDQLELFFRHAPAAIAVFDRDMNYVTVSDKWRRDYALGDQVLTGRSHYDVFPDIPEVWKDLHQKCLQGEVLVNREDPFVRADGATWWIEWELHPWFQDGEVKGLIMFTDVITERKLLNDELTAHRDHLQALVDARTREVEAKGEQNQFLRTLIATANGAATLEQAVAQVLDEICRFSGWECGEASLFVEAAGEAAPETVRTPDFTPVHPCVAVLPIHLGHVPVASFRFYSSRGSRNGQDVAATLADAEPQLARIIDRFGQERALTMAKEAAENSARSKSEFLSNMSHELRTPMHAILNYAAMGRKRLGAGGDDSGKLEKYLGNIETAGNRLLGLLNNLLDLAKLEAGRMVFHPVSSDLGTVLDHAATELDSLIRAKALCLTRTLSPDSGRGTFDPDKLMQVVVNLLSNAIKFSPPDSTLTASIEQVVVDGRPLLRFALSDQGAGIPADEVDHIFEPFIQSTGTKSGAGGTGLGLSICREIIGAHGGRIWAENAPAGGACFQFEIPVDAQPHDAARAA